MDSYLGLGGIHVENWERLGFTSAAVRNLAATTLIDAVVAHGSAVAPAESLTAHPRAGADHVAIRVLGNRDELLAASIELAPALGLLARR